MTAWPIMTSGFIQGLGVGLLFAPLNTVAYVTLDPAHRTEATVVSNMARSLGASLGISLLQASLIADSALAHARLAEKFIPGDPLVSGAVGRLVGGSALGTGAGGGPGGLEALNGEVTRQASMLGYNDVSSWMTLAARPAHPSRLHHAPAGAGGRDAGRGACGIGRVTARA